ncbi:MAG TPA: PilZ domain-containing protein [Xanthobacteraceae bacterium]|nr:PilZ domain-containing protein [Xanthobacteraceae bacterium]
MQERRQELRKRALKTGRVVFNNRYSVMDCTVRNLSRRGALLLVGETHALPDKFVLELDAGAVSHACKVIWRKERQLGVVFG